MARCRTSSSFTSSPPTSPDGAMSLARARTHKPFDRTARAMSAIVRFAGSIRTSREVRKVPMNEPALREGPGGAVGRLRLPQ